MKKKEKNLIKRKKEVNSIAVKQATKAGNAPTAIKSTAPLKFLNPQNELAVETKLTLVTPDVPNFAAMVLPEEAAVESGEEQSRTEKFRELGLISPTRGMANISNRLGGKIYAKIREDSKGWRTIVFLQLYGTGTYSPPISVSQANLQKAARNGFVSAGISEPMQRNKVAKFLGQIEDDYWGKFRGVKADELEVTDILAVLYEALSFLPVEADESMEGSEDIFYDTLISKIRNLNSWGAVDFKCYYALSEEEIGTLAAEMGMKKLDFLHKLKENELLYLTPSSNGLQTNVRVKGPGNSTYTAWKYCIFKMSFFAGIEDKGEDAENITNF